MEALAEYFVTNVDKGLWTGFVVLALYFVLKKEPFRLVTYYTDRRDKHHELARTLLDGGKLSPEANDFLRESLEKAAFARYYGLSADAKMRSGLIALCEEHHESFGWHHIRRAFPFLRLVGGRVAIKFDWYDHILRWVVTVLAWLTGAYSILAIVVALLSARKVGLLQASLLGLYSLLLLVGVMYFASLNWPYHAAKRIDSAVRPGNR